jgi:DNA-directed RNA polymerase specialized sigma24 family protein
MTRDEWRTVVGNAQALIETAKANRLRMLPARDAGFTLQEIGDMAGLTASGVKRALERSREQ